MIDAEREIALEQARSAATVQVDGGDNDGSGTVENPPTVVEFNEEEFLKEYDEKHAKKEVPPEPVYDEDNDFDLEF